MSRSIHHCPKCGVEIFDEMTECRACSQRGELAPGPGSAMFSAWTPDPVGAALGTGFMRFSARCGIDGLAKVSGDRLEVLAVTTDTPGLGCFRRFIADAKQHYCWVEVIDIWNPWLEGALARYGFTHFYRTEPDGEIVTGMLWQNTQAE